MTVMPGSGEVADKAVSTEDASSNVEVARLEAVLAALVETKVESMKASASTTTRRAGSAPASPRRPRLTSSSTASSSQNHYHHHHHHHHHHHNQQQNHHHQHHKHDRKKRGDRRHRRHDSAPCGEFIEDLVGQGNHHRTRNGKGYRRDSEQPKSPRKKRRHSRSPQGPQGPPILQNVLEGPGPDPELGLLGIDRDQQLNLLNFERAREAFGDSHEFPRLQQSSCCFSQSATQLKIHYDVDDYVALNLEDELEDEEENHNGQKKRRGPCDSYHRPKRKRKRRRRRVSPEEAPEELPDPEELPPRARWTIVATACLLLAMSLLLVGVTLRMAPIIDDMARRSMDYNRSDRLSDPVDDRVVFYIEDLTTDACQTSQSNFQAGKEAQGLYPPETHTYPSRSSSVYSPSGRPRRSRTIEGNSGTRRASLHGGRSRANSCNGPTPLGDGRRASVCRKNRPRRSSTVRRKESLQPGKAAAAAVVENVTKVQIPLVLQSPVEIEQDRQRRKIVMIVLGIFIFLLIASVLVVVITLTHSSFHRFPTTDLGNDSDAHHDNIISKGERGIVELAEPRQLRA